MFTIEHMDPVLEPIMSQIHKRRRTKPTEDEEALEKSANSWGLSTSYIDGKMWVEWLFCFRYVGMGALEIVPDKVARPWLEQMAGTVILSPLRDPEPAYLLFQKIASLTQPL